MQIKTQEPKLFDASKMKVGIVRARFNDEVTSKLLENAKTALLEYGVKDKNITVLEVSGAVEIPVTLQILAEKVEYDCLIALGCVIRGETDHYDYVCKMAHEGILRVMLDYNIPIGLGIITVHTGDQAEARLGFGRSAALAALEVANIKV